MILRSLIASLAVAASVPIGCARVDAAVGDEGLTITPGSVHLGEPIQVSGQFCPTGHEVSSVRAWHWNPSAAISPIEVPVDLGSLLISHTSDGFSFPYMATEAEVGVGIQVTCDDGTVGGSSSERVRVFGPFGRQWFLMPDGFLHATAGTTVNVVVRTMDCVEGSVATATLGRHINSFAGSAEATVVGGVMEFSLNVLRTAEPAVSDLVVDCTSVRGGTLSDLRPLTVLAGGTTIPQTGTTPTALLTSSAIVLLIGLAASGLNRRRRSTAAQR